MLPFDIAVNITLAHEKDYVFDPNDPGGETKYGISARAYPKLNIRSLSINDAKTIYKMDYWYRPNLDMLGNIAPDLAIKCFDLGVNCGPQTAVKFLQRAVNTVCFWEVLPARQSPWRQKIARLLRGQSEIAEQLKTDRKTIHRDMVMLIAGGLVKTNRGYCPTAAFPMFFERLMGD